MSGVLNMEFFQALNPLYAFPIIAVILCAFIVYAFGFKSPVQPPSFDGIEEEKKISKKRKTKETSKVKCVQNGKQNGSMSNKSQVLSSTKKKDVDKSVPIDKLLLEKNASEKKEKIIKKGKASNEKKIIQDKEKENLSQLHEDAAEDGWVQLISKKGRKNRKKDDMITTESQTVIKPLKTIHVDKSDANENTPSEDFLEKADVLEKPIPEKKLEMKNDNEDDIAKKEVVIIEDNSTLYDDSIEKVPVKDVLKNEKSNEEISNKSKKKKKKNVEVINKNNDCIIPSESLAVQVTPELSQNATNNSTVRTETPQIITGKMQESEPKELKTSNIVFDELEGLYPKEKEQRKKKKVRRDH